MLLFLRLYLIIPKSWEKVLVGPRTLSRKDLCKSGTGSHLRNLNIYLYILLLCYIVICLYIYIGIVLFFYCFIACLKHGSIVFFISISYFCSLLRSLFFIIVVAVSLSFGFLLCKGMVVLSDTKHQAKPYSAKTFPERLPQMLHIWVFQKTFYRIVWCSDSWNHHLLMHVKRLYDDEMTEW